MQGKHGVEIRIDSVNSKIITRRSEFHGFIKLVMDFNNEQDDNEQETSATRTEVFALQADPKLKQNELTFACSSTRTERISTDIETRTYSSIACPVSKRLSTLLRHGDVRRKKMEILNSEN